MSVRELWDIPAPAKLNLFLHIVGRRVDGYHLLQSVFMLIDWCDTLHFECRHDGHISRTDLNHTGPHLPAQDLVVRAAQALQKATGCTLGAHISLEKHIPQEAGLGGGSSDAASALMALNRLWNLQLTRQQLIQIGLGLGADVPFFLGGSHAWVEGIGEHLTPVQLPAAEFLILKPPTGASTPKIFQSPELQRQTPRTSLADFCAAGDCYAFGHNDLQAVAEKLCPDIQMGLDLLKTAHLSPIMTGSGSAVFAHIQQDVPDFHVPPHWMTKKCQNLFEHPLKQWQK